MKIRFRYSGDFTGITREARVDLTAVDCALTANAVAQISQWAGALPKARAKSAARAAADAGVYEIELAEGSADARVTTFARGAVPAEIATAINELMRLAKPIKP